MHTFNPTVAIAAVALLSALPTANAGFYTKNSPVLQVDAKSYDKLIAKSNQTSVSLGLLFYFNVAAYVSRQIIEYVICSINKSTSTNLP